MIFVMTIGSLCWSSVSASYHINRGTGKAINILESSITLTTRNIWNLLGSLLHSSEMMSLRKIRELPKLTNMMVMIRLSLGKYNDNRWHRRVIGDRVVINIPWGNKMMIKIDRRWWWQSAGMHAEWLWVCIRLWLQAIISSFVTPPRIKNTNLDYKCKAFFN